MEISETEELPSSLRILLTCLFTFVRVGIYLYQATITVEMVVKDKKFSEWAPVGIVAGVSRVGGVSIAGGVSIVLGGVSIV